ncbi:MAG: hypothetical protein ACLGI6_05820 [Gammaproteobacteria bacterium]
MKKILIAALLAGAATAQAGEFTVSGFATLAGGKAMDGWDGQLFDAQCPCFIGNYEHGAVYQNNQLSFAHESLAGLQGKYQFSDKLSGTVQGVARASKGAHFDLDWAYLSYDLTPEVTLQAGRRRLPIYAYSDSVYVGYTLPWVRVPQDIYGWEVGAYNGANVSYTTSLGDWAVRANLFAGQETTRDNVEMRNIYYGHKVDDAWKHILGGYLDVSNDVFGARLIYMQNSIDLKLYVPDEAPSFSTGVRQRIIGLSGSIDYRNWMVRAEANTFQRPSLDYRSRSFTATVGYRWGKFTPLVGYSSYKEKLTDTYTAAQIDTTRFAAVRWDFRKNMDLKIQFDKVIDRSAYDFTHDAKMISASVDVIF